MSKRRVHDVSDSEDDADLFEGVSTPPRETKTTTERKISSHGISDDEGAGGESPSRPQMSPMSAPDNESRALANVDSYSGQSQMSLLCLDLDENVERTPRSFRVVDAPKRPGRKLRHQMFAFVLDRSPSKYNGLEDYGNYILKRKVIDTFMRMRLDKFQKHHTLVMTCCDKNTDNLSNREQAKTLNKNCVEILSAEEITVDQIRALSETSPIEPEDEQISHVMAGLMTAADLISRSVVEFEAYEKIEVTLFSDLNFDPEETSITKMSRVLSVVLPDTRLTVISNPAAIASEKYEANLAFLRNIFEQVEVQPYKDAKKKCEEWSMAEQLPTKFGASIKLFDEEIPIDAYLVCNEKNSSLLKTRLEKASGNNESIGVAESALREDKQLVKLTDDGHYMKGDDGSLVTVDAERAAIAYKFGTTAVPSEKKLTEFVPSDPSHKGYVIKGWYPAHEFALYVSGGKAYRVFPGSQNCSVFDSLLMLCARKGYALLVDYSYQARFDPKPGVLIPHHKKRCFVYYDLIHEDNLNYLPRYDPINFVKPPAKNLKKMCDIIAASQLDHLDLKYDPASQQVIEDCWQSEIGENPWKFHDKFAEVTYKKDAALLEKIEDFKDNADGFVRRLTVQRKENEPDRDDDLIPFNVEPLEDKRIEKVKNFRKLFEG